MADDWVTLTEWTERKLRDLAKSFRLRAEKDRATKARVTEQKVTKQLDQAIVAKRETIGGTPGELLDNMRAAVRADAKSRGIIDKQGEYVKPGVDPNNRPAEKMVKDEVTYGKGPHGVSKKGGIPITVLEERAERDRKLTEALRERELRLLERNEASYYLEKWIKGAKTPEERVLRTDNARGEMRQVISGEHYVLDLRRSQEENRAYAAACARTRERISFSSGKELRDRAKERRAKALEKHGGLQI